MCVRLCELVSAEAGPRLPGGLEQPELLTGAGDLPSQRPSVARSGVWGGSCLRGASAAFLAQAGLRADGWQVCGHTELLN